jgi:DNA-binding transcriptional ArsR family regulator
MEETRELEKIYKALGNRRRLEILRFIKRNQRSSVTAIAEKMELSIKASSKHLVILFNAGALERAQAGYSVLYRLADNPPVAVKLALDLL